MLAVLADTSVSAEDRPALVPRLLEAGWHSSLWGQVRGKEGNQSRIAILSETSDFTAAQS
jgi:hypothetical protein